MALTRTIAWLTLENFRPIADSTAREAFPDAPAALPGRAQVFLEVWPAATLINEADRLLESLGIQGIVVQAISARSNAPVIHSRYDPANGLAMVMLEGVDDALLPAP